MLPLRPLHDRVVVTRIDAENKTAADLDRFHLVMNTIDRLPQIGAKGIYLKQEAQGQADRAQAIHRQIRRGPAGNSKLAVGCSEVICWSSYSAGCMPPQAIVELKGASICPVPVLDALPKGKNK